MQQHDIKRLISKIWVIVFCIFPTLSCYADYSLNEEMEKRIAYKLGKSIVVTLPNYRFNEKNSEYKLKEFAYQDGKIKAKITDISGKVINISGKYDYAHTLPTLKYKIAKGDVISANAIKMQKFSISVNSSDIIKDSKLILGKEAKISLAPYKPVKFSQLKMKDIIKKKGEVIVRFIKGKIMIEATCLSLEAGKVGDMIKLKNLASGKIVKGRVQKDGTILVKS